MKTMKLPNVEITTQEGSCTVNIPSSAHGFGVTSIGGLSPETAVKLKSAIVGAMQCAVDIAVEEIKRSVSELQCNI